MREEDNKNIEENIIKKSSNIENVRLSLATT